MALGVVICFVLAAVLGLLARHVLLKARASETWPTVTGQVLQASMEVSESESTDGSASTSFSATIVYGYEVADRSFTGKRLAWGPTVSSGTGWRSARATLAQYPAGSAVRVYYDPAKPSSAVLHPERRGGVLALAVVAAIPAVIGVVLLYQMLRAAF